MKSGTNRRSCENCIYLAGDLRLQVLHRNQGNDLVALASPTLGWLRTCRKEQENQRATKRFDFHRENFTAGADSVEVYSNASGVSWMFFSPAARFSQYFFTQASKLLPAAGSRSLNFRAAMSEYGIESFSRALLGMMRTNESPRVFPVLRSKT